MTNLTMALPFFDGQSKRIDQLIAVDLGARHSKAVHLQNKDGRLVLLGYAVLDAPNREKGFNPAALGDHLKGLFKAAGGNRPATLALGVPEAFVRHAELAPMPLDDMRQMLRLNSKNFLQQDYPDHVFDCSVMLPKPAATPQGSKPAPTPAGSSKQKVLVGGAKQQVVNNLKEACRMAGLTAHQIVPGMIGPVNAFEVAEPDVFSKQVVALVDIGFKNSTITMLNKGELVMNRVVTIGGDHLTAGLAEYLGTSHAEAENLKIGMTADVQQHLEPVVTLLGRELRASIDFFEHQQDVTVSEVFVSGGLARNQIMVQLLQAELMVACKPWNPTQRLELALPVEQRARLEELAPQLVVAIGAGVASF